MSDSGEPGCLLVCNVKGSKGGPYQIISERLADKRLHWSCTCADMQFRQDKLLGHICKHIQMLLRSVPADLKAYVPVPPGHDLDLSAEIEKRFGEIDQFLSDSG